MAAQRNEVLEGKNDKGKEPPVPPPHILRLHSRNCIKARERDIYGKLCREMVRALLLLPEPHYGGH